MERSGVREAVMRTGVPEREGARKEMERSGVRERERVRGAGWRIHSWSRLEREGRDGGSGVAVAVASRS